MELKLISMKVPAEMLARIDRAAEERGMSRTALLLEPWSGGVEEVVQATPRRATSPTPRPSKPEKPTIEALTDDGAVFRASTGLQLGPERRKPGDLLKGKKS